MSRRGTREWLESKGYTLWAHFDLSEDIDTAAEWFDRQLRERYEFVVGDRADFRAGAIEANEVLTRQEVARKFHLEPSPGVEVVDKRTLPAPARFARVNPPPAVELDPTSAQPPGFFQVQLGSKFVSNVLFTDLDGYYTVTVELPDWERFHGVFRDVPDKPGWITNVEPVVTRKTS
jgi:hypothetical protein